MAAPARAANSGIGIPTPPFRPDHITLFTTDRWSDRNPLHTAQGKRVPGALDQNVIEAGFKVLHKLTFGCLRHETQIRAHIRVLRDVAEDRNRA